MANLSDHKSLAENHVTVGRRIVQEQRQRIADIKARGGVCDAAEDLLWAFEATLTIFEDDLTAITAREQETRSGVKARRSAP